MTQKHCVNRGSALFFKQHRIVGIGTDGTLRMFCLKPSVEQSAGNLHANILWLARNGSAKGLRMSTHFYMDIAKCLCNTIEYLK